MSVQNHLKVATSEIMKAADLVRREINELRAEETNLQKMINQDIANLTAQISSREQEAKVTDDPSLRSQGQTLINHLHRQIAEAKNQLGKDQQRIQEAIRQKETLISTLDQQARAIQ